MNIGYGIREFFTSPGRKADFGIVNAARKKEVVTPEWKRLADTARCSNPQEKETPLA
jgi:hypothetical protein